MGFCNQNLKNLKHPQPRSDHPAKTLCAFSSLFHPFYPLHMDWSIVRFKKNFAQFSASNFKKKSLVQLCTIIAFLDVLPQWKAVPPSTAVHTATRVIFQNQRHQRCAKRGARTLSQKSSGVTHMLRKKQPLPQHRPRSYERCCVWMQHAGIKCRGNWSGPAPASVYQHQHISTSISASAYQHQHISINTSISTSIGWGDYANNLQPNRNQSNELRANRAFLHVMYRMPPPHPRGGTQLNTITHNYTITYIYNK